MNFVDREYRKKQNHANYTKVLNFLRTLGTTDDKYKKTIINIKEVNGTHYLDIKKHKEFFDIYDKAIKTDDIRMHIQENPIVKPTSGIVLDFDPYYKSETNFDIADYRKLIKACFQELKKLLEIKELKTVVFVTKAQNPSEKNNLVKVGFHIIIPGVCINTGAKKHYLTKLAKNTTVKKLFTKYDCQNKMTKVVDQNLANNSIFLYRSCKVGSNPYLLENVFNVTLDDDDIIVDKQDKKERHNWNLSLEMSILFEGNIKQHIYETKYDKVKVDIEESSSYKIQLNKLFTIDAEAIHIKEVIDSIDPNVFSDFQSWKKFVSAIANINCNYMPLAKYGSMKCPNKYKSKDTEKLLKKFFDDGIAEEATWGKPTLYKMVKEYKGDDYLQTLKENNMVEYIRETAYLAQGKIGDSDFAYLLSKMLKDYYKVSYDELRSADLWYYMSKSGPHAFKWEVYPKNKVPSAIYNDLVPSITPILSTVRDYYYDLAAKNSEDKNKHSLYINISKQLSNCISAIRNHPKQTTIINSLKVKLDEKNFSKKLDKTPNVIGINGGVLKLPMYKGEKCKAIYTSNDYNISINTNRVYKPYDKNDEDIKEVYNVLKDGFYISEEEDVHNWGYDKESMDYYLFHYARGLLKTESMTPLIIGYGDGSNLKSMLNALLQNTLSTEMSTNISMKFLTSDFAATQGPNPYVIKMINKTHVNFNEGTNEVLNEALLKWLLSPGIVKTARELNSNPIDFTLNCVFTCDTNELPIIQTSQHAIWRRMVIYNFKTKFLLNKQDIKKPWHKLANPYYGEKWVNEERIKNAFFVILCHYLEVLINKYDGDINNVPHDKILKETYEYRLRQDNIEHFISKYTKDSDSDLKLETLAQAYIDWYSIKVGLTTLYLTKVIAKFKSTERFEIKKIDGIEYVKNIELNDIYEDIDEDM